MTLDLNLARTRSQRWVAITARMGSINGGAEARMESRALIIHSYRVRISALIKLCSKDHSHFDLEYVDEG